MSNKPRLHIAFAAFTAAYYRWEVQRMIPVIYPGEEVPHMEPDVGQIEDDLLPDDAIVGDSVWAVYGRRTSGIADHIADFDELEPAMNLVRALGASSDNVLPGPTSECHGRPVLFANDDASIWKADDWERNARRMARQTGKHFGDVINNYAEAWGRSVGSHKMPYSVQYLLEEINKLMAAAV
jgi:hypothetical protein